MRNRSKVFGVGINDLPYAVTRYERVGDKEKQVWVCPYYACWGQLLRRVYNQDYKISNKTYQNTSVDKNWLLCSNFKIWMQDENWEGLQLDKDILLKGNKHYSPETCVFVPAYINSCLNIRVNDRGVYPIGVSVQGSKFKSQCEGKRSRHLGLFNTAEDAHNAWKIAKLDNLKEILEKYVFEEAFNQKVFDAISKRVDDLQLAIIENKEVKEI